jgi:hypothetical protein
MSVEKALDTFGKRVQQQSRSYLTKNKNNASGDLYKGTKYSLTVSPNSFSLSFPMTDYWQFFDSGVKGVGGKRADKIVNGKLVKGEEYKTKRVINSPFSYKTKKPPAHIFEKWAKQKGIKPRGENGRFTSYKSFGFAVATSVFHTGLKTTKFFTTPFENEFNKLPNDLVEAYALELDDFLKFTTT